VIELSIFYRRGREEEIEVNKGFGVTEATLSVSLALSLFYRRGREEEIEGLRGFVLRIMY
jgi:hypothetical protein